MVVPKLPDRIGAPGFRAKYAALEVRMKNLAEADGHVLREPPGSSGSSTHRVDNRYRAPT
jgi:hypothetical protein